MDAAQLPLAERFRRLSASGRATPDEVRDALSRLAPCERDAFVDLAFQLEPAPDDGPELPRGCVPYLPCAVHTLQQALDAADVRATDVVVDIGSGAGRTGALVQLLTGASVIGVEIQHGLVQASRELMARLNLHGFTAFECDALSLPTCLASGSVFFLYCPFSGSRLEGLLGRLEQIARAREIRVCCVDLPLPPRSWLTAVASTDPSLTVYRSSLARAT